MDGVASGRAKTNKRWNSSFQHRDTPKFCRCNNSGFLSVHNFIRFVGFLPRAVRSDLSGLRRYNSLLRFGRLSANTIHSDSSLFRSRYNTLRAVGFLSVSLLRFFFSVSVRPVHTPIRRRSVGNLNSVSKRKFVRHQATPRVSQVLD